MNITNVHERTLNATVEEAGALIGSLGSRHDRLWPSRLWPAMCLGAKLGVGAAGGHGSIRYFAEEYIPNRSVSFCFTAPAGFNGFHRFEVVPIDQGSVILRHSVEMNTSRLAVLSWPLVFQPLHDALIEDALAKAQGSLGLTPDVRPWSFWVRSLRWLTSAGKARPQGAPRIRERTTEATLETT